MLCTDLGHGQLDVTNEIEDFEVASYETTMKLAAEVDSHDFVMHVGDIAYAEGFSTSVRKADGCD